MGKWSGCKYRLIINGEEYDTTDLGKWAGKAIADEHNGDCDFYESKIAELTGKLAAVTTERDLYKPYYDAVIDMAVVSWTLDGLSQKDAHYAIQKLIGQHIQEACDPKLNEELAKRDKKIAELSAKLEGEA